MTGRRTGRSGFTLLEIMVALAILSSTLVVLIQVITNNIRATNHSKLTTAATFLARGKMIDIEDLIYENGFTDDNETEKGTFQDQGFAAFRWEAAIERVELPTDAAQKAQDAASDKTQSGQTSKDPMSALTGMMGGLMSSFLDPIRLGLQESVRRVTVKVTWDETSRPNQTLEVVSFLTDPAKLQSSLLGLGAPTGGAPSGATPNAPGLTGGGLPGLNLPGLGGIKR
jgi:prepilin-type N-terminal cleavage/methylation domain-containing protein